MYAVIRHYAVGAGSIESMTEMVENEFADRIPDLVGSLLYTAIDTGDGTATTVTVFPDEETFRHSAPTVARVQSDLADRFQVEEISLLHGDVLISRGSDVVSRSIHYRR